MLRSLCLGSVFQACSCAAKKEGKKKSAEPLKGQERDDLNKKVEAGKKKRERQTDRGEGESAFSRDYTHSQEAIKLKSEYHQETIKQTWGVF